MKKRIAVFANGWGSELLYRIGTGLSSSAKEYNADIFAFVNFSAFDSSPEYNRKEFHIFDLPDIQDFDGVILLSNSFNLPNEISFFTEMIRKSGKPAVSIESRLPGTDYLGTDNYTGMYELAEHLFTEHEISDFVMICGLEEHGESKVRLKAVRDAAKNNGVPFPEENILYGHFAAAVAEQELKKWLDRHDQLPEAIICVNDVMALGIMDYLKEQGYQVPEDILVTGYDCILDGRNHEPVLTSVSHEWENMGNQAMELLMEQIGGRKDRVEREIPTRMSCGESCGCRLLEKHFMDKAPMDGFTTDRHFRHLYSAISKVKAGDEFHKKISDFMQKEGNMEGKDFMLCLQQNFFQYAEDEYEYFGDECGEKVDLICSMHKGRARKRMRMKTKDFVFRVANDTPEPGTYIFVSVNGDRCLYGYGMITRGFDVALNNVLYIWTRHLDQYLEQIRTNIKMQELTRRLEVLSVTDHLSGVYNRTGCENIIYPYLEKCQSELGQGVIMIADIDKMKNINDTLGHGYGDLAILTVAEALRKGLPKEYMIGRYGGDEFIAAGEKREDMELEDLIDRVQEQLKQEMKLHQITFPITLSMGGTVLKKGEQFHKLHSLQAADKAMYAMKRIHHEAFYGEEQ